MLFIDLRDDISKQKRYNNCCQPRVDVVGVVHGLGHYRVGNKASENKMPVGSMDIENPAKYRMILVSFFMRYIYICGALVLVAR